MPRPAFGWWYTAAWARQIPVTQVDATADRRAGPLVVNAIHMSSAARRWPVQLSEADEVLARCAEIFPVEVDGDDQDNPIGSRCAPPTPPALATCHGHPAHIGVGENFQIDRQRSDEAPGTTLVVACSVTTRLLRRTEG